MNKQSNQVTQYPKVLLVDLAEIGEHLATILMNQFRCDITKVTEMDQLHQTYKEHYELVLIIDRRSGETGYEIGKRLRELEAEEKKKPIPIVTLLSKPHEPDEIENMPSDLEKYAIYPMQDIDFGALLRKWLEKVDEASLVDLDTNILDDLAQATPEGCADLLKESIDLYIQQFKEKREEIQFAWYKMDNDKVRMLSHFMKSSSYTIGAQRLAYYFSLLEKTIEDINAFEAKLNEIDECFERTVKQMHTYIEKSSMNPNGGDA